MTKTSRPDDSSSGFFMPKLSVFKMCRLAFLLLFLSTTVFANEEPVANVTHTNGLYRSSLSARIDTPPDRLFQFLTDYSHLSTFSRLIDHSQRLPDGNLFLRLKVCFVVFCFDKQQTLKLSTSNYSITGHIIPEHSDFKSGWMMWRLENTHGSSIINFSSELTPDFWVPPFIGPLLIQYKLKNEAEYSIQQLEKLSRLNNSAQ